MTRYVPFSDRHGRTPDQRKPFPFGELVPESTPTFTLERKIQEARKHMGEARWAELNAEWNPQS